MVRRMKKQAANFVVYHGDETNHLAVDFGDKCLRNSEIDIPHIVRLLVEEWPLNEGVRAEAGGAPYVNDSIGVVMLIRSDHCQRYFHVQAAEWLGQRIIKVFGKQAQLSRR